MDLKAIYSRNKNILSYLFFGICTTIVNIAIYWLMAHPLRMTVMPSTIIAWIIAVFFAYITNRKWVFHSNAYGLQQILREIIAFFTCRILTGLVDWGCMFILVNILHYNDVLIKTFANILVIILNYVASKLIIFKPNK